MTFLQREQVAGYVFITPFIIGLFAFTLIPMIASLALSFTNYDILSTPKFAGLDNYIRMLTQDKVFWKSFGVTFFYAIISVPLKLIMALMIAIFFQRTSRATSVYRAVYYLPSIMGGSVAVAVLWRRMFASDGVINGILQHLGINSSIGWLSGTKTAIWTLIILSVWQFGSSMLVFLAGLKQIPTTLYEAARVDGCSRIMQFFKITLPMLTPVIFFNLIQQTINAFMAFTQSYVITGGKPLNSTLFYTVYMYQRSFQYSEMGYGSAMAWFMLAVVALLTVLIFRSSSSWVYRASDDE
ncbi:sugar ABC transporter permease [Anaerocolumna sp. AGMB13025]|uniref:carbohydrate ABC transporter permease n=1 Tax=Anaerocolumna sp. AGMB13025 TaxID=3039116 RepID=UPI00241F1115|nr:sugar ABC transporter permease [Anaerocolumna sp. AGMB13025]WFR57425.1 sugar ABC transporter permease [Anaerocolumna sp. AGMB13025]